MRAIPPAVPLHHRAGAGGRRAGAALLAIGLVDDLGASALVPLVVLAAAIRLPLALARLGGWPRSSPAIAYGLLAGLGLLALPRYVHLLFDAAPLTDALANLRALPARFAALSPATIAADELAFGIGLLTLVVTLGWTAFRTAALASLPGVAVGLLAAGVAAALLSLDIAYVDLAAMASGNDRGSPWLDPAVAVAALALAVIAGARPLLPYDVPGRAGTSIQSLAASLIAGGTLVALFALRAIPSAALGTTLLIAAATTLKILNVRALARRFGLPSVAAAFATAAFTVLAGLAAGAIAGVVMLVIEDAANARRHRIRNIS